MSIPAKSTLRPRYAVSNTFSGQAGELAFSALCVRAGLRVAQPLWADDYTDTLILLQSQGWVIPLPVQVKSVQQASKAKPEVSVQGLKKKYVDRVPALCLAIYSPAHDKLWFIPGANNIRDVYQQWVEKERAGPGRKPVPYDDILIENDIPIRVNVSTSGDASFDGKWLIDRKSPVDLSIQLNNLADRLVTEAKRRDAFASEITEWLRSSDEHHVVEESTDSES
jgi:hypothetical protein